MKLNPSPWCVVPVELDPLTLAPGLPRCHPLCFDPFHSSLILRTWSRSRTHARTSTLGFLFVSKARSCSGLCLLSCCCCCCCCRCGCLRVPSLDTGRRYARRAKRHATAAAEAAKAAARRLTGRSPGSDSVPHRHCTYPSKSTSTFYNYTLLYSQLS